jgi:hypothetical protein
VSAAGGWGWGKLEQDLCKLSTDLCLQPLYCGRFLMIDGKADRLAIPDESLATSPDCSLVPH